MNVSGLLIFLAVMQTVAANVQLSIEPARRVERGETVTVTCSLSNIKIYERCQIAREYDGDRFPIVDKNEMQAPFTSDGRYSVDGARNNALCTLQITEVNGIDAGKFVCLKLGPSVEQATEDLQVIVPPRSVGVLVNGEILSGPEVELTSADEPVSYGCSVEVDGDFHPVERVRLALGGQNLALGDVNDNQMKESVEGGYSRFRIMSDYTLSEPSLFDPQNDGKTLACLARNGEYPALTSEVTLRILYGPTMVTCHEMQHYRLGDDMVVSCSLRMNPEPSSAEWLWKDDEILIGEERADQSIRTSVQQEGDVYNYEFHLDNVEDGVVPRTMELRVTDSKQKAHSFPITLQLTIDIDIPKTTPSTKTTTTPKVKTGGFNPNSAQVSTASSVLLIASLVLAMLK